MTRSSARFSVRRCLPSPTCPLSSSSHGALTTPSGGSAPSSLCVSLASIGRRPRSSSRPCGCQDWHRISRSQYPPVAIGQPTDDYPYRWAVHRWIPGNGGALDRIDDPVTFALDLANAVRLLQALSTADAPPATNRARPLAEYDEATRGMIARASHLIDAHAALAVWEDALAARPHQGSRLWVQGDLEGNCLVQDGRLCGIVDWGSACSGDPAVDIQVVWSPLFTDDSRRAFLDALGVDDAALARSRGAAIHQACGALPYYLHTYPGIVDRSWHKLAMLGVQPLEAE
jgi:hypothetical protein